MNDKDRQELDVLRKYVQHLQIEADQRDHQLIMLHKHAAKRDEQIAHLLTMLGLQPTDRDAPGALTPNLTFLLRLSRSQN